MTKNPLLRSFNIRVHSSLLLLFALTPGALAQEPAFIRVCSFNIANFGAGDESERSLVSIVNILRAADADIIALQEIEPTAKGEQQLDRLLALLNKAAAFYKTPTYAVAQPQERSGDEQTAFLWRAPVELLEAPILLPHQPDPDGNGKRVFQRVPSVARFRARAFDFYVVNCHLYTKPIGKTSEGRVFECATLAGWLRVLTTASDRDAVVLGDFNRFLGGKTPWAQFTAPENAAYLRLALLEAIAGALPGFDPATDDAKQDDRYSTTTSGKGSIYDQIILSTGTSREFTPTPAFGVDAGIVAFDREKDYEWFSDDWKLVTQVISDHRPVWVRLRIDLPDDD